MFQSSFNFTDNHWWFSTGVTIVGMSQAFTESTKLNRLNLNHYIHIVIFLRFLWINRSSTKIEQWEDGVYAIMDVIVLYIIKMESRWYRAIAKMEKRGA